MKLNRLTLVVIALFVLFAGTASYAADANEKPPHAQDKPPGPALSPRGGDARR